MPSLIDQFRPKVEALCRKYEVKRLELFGSAARGNFSDAESDIDLLVLFERSTGSAKYFDLLGELEQLFGRKVDLIDINAARNPYFIAEALRSRISLYAA